MPIDLLRISYSRPTGGFPVNGDLCFRSGAGHNDFFFFTMIYNLESPQFKISDNLQVTMMQTGL